MSRQLHCAFTTPAGHLLRSFSEETGTFWLVAGDVIPALGLSGAQKALSRVDVADRRQIGKDSAYGLHPHTVVINEARLYAIASSSRKPQVPAFMTWFAATAHPLMLSMLRVAKACSRPKATPSQSSPS